MFSFLTFALAIASGVLFFIWTYNAKRLANKKLGMLSLTLLCSFGVAKTVELLYFSV